MFYGQKTTCLRNVQAGTTSALPLAVECHEEIVSLLVDSPSSKGRELCQEMFLNSVTCGYDTLRVSSLLRGFFFFHLIDAEDREGKYALQLAAENALLRREGERSTN